MRQQVDLRWVRRTFARLLWLANRANADVLAKLLVEHGATDGVQFCRDYLGDLWVEIGPLLSRPKRPCAVCGQDIRDIDRPDARYCSRACQQRAYRKRVTTRQTERTADPSQTRKCDASLHPPGHESRHAVETDRRL
jgi:predicted nucleic acid-binding Zn ribbon protein